MASTLADRLRCESATPFGTDVDPDVNWTNAMSSSVGRLSGSIAGATRASRASTSASAGHRPRPPSKAGRGATYVTHASPVVGVGMPTVSVRSVAAVLVVTREYG